MLEGLKIFLFLTGGCLFFNLSSLEAEWNEEFDRKTQEVIQNFELLKQPYLDSYRWFLKSRKGLLKDFLLLNQIRAAAFDQKLVILRPREGLVVKKRSCNNTIEFFAWEVACLTGGADFLVPSFPLEIGGKIVIVQRMEPLSFSKERVIESVSSEARKVGVEEYWKAHFTAYLLGINDLVAQNVGINPLGHIRFFDVESGFGYRNYPYRTETGFNPGFVAQSLEWPQYRKPLNSSEAVELTRFVEGLSSFEVELEKYLALRQAEIDVEDLLFRLQKIRDFPIEEAKTFCDFYAFIFPKMASGLDELSGIASKILKRKVDHGSALMTVSRWIYKYELSSSQKKTIENWISNYIDP